MKFVICCTVIVLGCNLSCSTKLFECSSSICKESSLFVVSSSEFSLDCIRPAANPPRSSTANPNTSMVNPTVSIGRILGLIYLTDDTTQRLLFSLKTTPIHFRNIFFFPHLTKYSAPSSTTPITTTMQPTTASPDQKLSQAESEEVMKKCYKRLEFSYLVTGIALIIYAIFITINILVTKK